jgi:hypothetical protein
MDLKEVIWKGVDWLHPVQDREQWKVLLNTIMNL